MFERSRMSVSSPVVPKMVRAVRPGSLGTVCRFAEHPFWNRAAPLAAEVTEHVTRAMHLVSHTQGGGTIPFTSLAGTAVDAFIGLQRPKVLSKRAWNSAPPVRPWLPNSPDVLKRAGLAWNERDPHGPRGIDQVLLRVVVPRGYGELAEVVRQVLWLSPPGQAPELCEAAALLVVARFDQLYRAGQPAAVGLERLKAALPVRRGFKRALVKLFPREMLEGVRQTCRTLLQLLPREQPFVYNPQWRRMGRLGASDGDFIAGRTLYELKCFDPRSGRFSREHLFQLLGYACMNACPPPGYHLEALGFINPRAGFVWTMSLNALCRAIGAGSF